MIEAGLLDGASAFVVNMPAIWPHQRSTRNRLAIAVLGAGAAGSAIARVAAEAFAGEGPGDDAPVLSELAGWAASSPGAARCRELIAGVAARNPGAAWAWLLRALASSRRGDHGAALDLARRAVALDRAKKLPPPLLLEVACRPAAPPDGDLCREALARLAPGTPHARRVATFVHAAAARDVASTRASVLELIDDEPTATLWAWSLATTTAERTPPDLDRSVRRIQAIHRYNAANLWMLEPLEALLARR
jgi:hypothetical protein